jgi:hypothetical protein
MAAATPVKDRPRPGHEETALLLPPWVSCGGEGYVAALGATIELSSRLRWLMRVHDAVDAPVRTNLVGYELAAQGLGRTLTIAVLLAGEAQSFEGNNDERSVAGQMSGAGVTACLPGVGSAGM